MVCTPGSPFGACQMSSSPASFSAALNGAWSEPMVSTRPARTCSHSASTVSRERSGGAHFAYGPCSSSAIASSTRYWGAVSIVIGTPRERTRCAASTPAALDPWTT